MTSYHEATFALLGRRPTPTTEAADALARAEGRLGARLPASVREWYGRGEAISILAEHSNADPPIPVEDFAAIDSPVGRLLPIRWENQGVCTWAVRLDDSDDPPVFVDVDTAGAHWLRFAETFSLYVHSCVWDYRQIHLQPTIVQAQNKPLSAATLATLATRFAAGPRTSGWPHSEQY